MRDEAEIMLIIRPEPAGPDDNGVDRIVRLRRILKDLLRRYGWRCVSICQTGRARAAAAESKRRTWLPPDGRSQNILDSDASIG